MIAYILAILAAYRVARVLAMEEGPLSVFAQVRERFDPEQATWVGRGLNCPLCIGCYISLAVALLLLPFATWQALTLNWLGVWGGMALVHLWVEK